MNRNLLSLLLLISVIWATALPAAETEVVTLTPGLKHLTIRKGEAATETSYRILVGTFDRQSEADQALEQLRKNGFTGVADANGTDYRIVVPGFAQRSQAEEMRARLVDLGFDSPLPIQTVENDLSHPHGPWAIHVLEADPKKIRVEVAHAYDAAIGLETTAALASRRGALAAINGGYFRMTGLLAGDSLGTLRIDGRLLSEPDRGRATVGFYDQNNVTQSVFGRLGFRGQVIFGGNPPIVLNGINRPRGDSEIVLFTPQFHRTTLTSPGGTELVIEQGRVSEIRKGAGSTVIPPNGAVLSIGSDRGPEVISRVEAGDGAAVATTLLPLLPGPEREWTRARFIVGGGPLLLWKGRRLEEPEKESISKVFFLARHPRTAVGARSDGTLIFVTVDGRQPSFSVGMSIPELTDLMLELGCESAINLDGGGSTTMVINGEVVNRPSGFSGPRRNADAILLFPKASDR